ncbi:MAG TPA: hypothetical protein VF163_09970 [Micromonosporaceae bacterium]
MTMAEPQPAPTALPPEPARGPRRPRRWLVALTVAWGLVLAAGIVWSVRHGEASAREQTTIAQAQPVVDRALAHVAAAASGDGRAVVAVSGFDRVGECAVTVFRGGVRYQRSVRVLVPPGTEPALLQRVGAALPASYQVAVRTGPVPRLSADAGLFVQLTGSVVAPGQVAFVADTGDCRQEGDLPVAANQPPVPGSAEAQSVLTALRLAPAATTTQRLSCPDGGELSTVELLGPEGGYPGPLNLALRGFAGVEPSVATATVFAYRDGTVEVGARVANSRIVVTATTMCPG